jgi:hypothetical protein
MYIHDMTVISMINAEWYGEQRWFFLKPVNIKNGEQNGCFGKPVNQLTGFLQNLTLRYAF